MSEATHKALRVLRAAVSAGTTGWQLTPRDLRELLDHIDGLERQVEAPHCAMCRAAADAAAEQGASPSAPKAVPHA